MIAGISSSVYAASPPGAPTGIIANRGSKSASVAFIPPASNGGAPITSYTATSSPGGFTGSSATSPITVSGLTNFTSYTFTVTATNSAGTGIPSAVSNSVTPDSDPGAPTGVTATVGNKSATVTFTPPAPNGGSPVTGYIVTATPGGFYGVGSSSPITVTGLTNGTAYTFTVAATNLSGTGIASLPSNRVTPPGIDLSGGTPPFTRSQAGATAIPITTSGTPPNYIDSDTLLPNTIYKYYSNSVLFKTFRTPLYSGWNIFGVPSPSGLPVSDLFGGSHTSAVSEWVPTSNSSIAGYNPDTSGHFKTVTTLEPGKGYFVFAGYGSTMLNYSAAADAASVDVTLNPGYTLITGIKTTNMTNIGDNWLIDGGPLADAVTGNIIGGAIYWWNGQNFDSWNIVDNPAVEPWKAYWILNMDFDPHTLTIQ